MGIAVFMGAWYGLEFLSGPPIELLDSKVLTPAVKQGEPVRLYVKVTSFVNRQCPGTITREWTRPSYADGNVVPEIYRDDAPAPMAHETRREYVINIPTIIRGEYIPPGEWSFQGETGYYCSWWAKTRFRTKPNTITILARG